MGNLNQERNSGVIFVHKMWPSMLLTEISQSLMEEHLSTLQGLCIMANRQWSESEKYSSPEPLYMYLVSGTSAHVVISDQELSMSPQCMPLWFRCKLFLWEFINMQTYY